MKIQDCHIKSISICVGIPWLTPYLLPDGPCPARQRVLTASNINFPTARRGHHGVGRKGLDQGLLGHRSEKCHALLGRLCAGWGSSHWLSLVPKFNHNTHCSAQAKWARTSSPVTGPLKHPWTMYPPGRHGGNSAS